uniref:F-box and leucine rich repeat protein 13 n=1 Tax=Macrostomum lignano TaxID=282301 RepID=A0A1I8F3D9_9PLAT
LRILELLCGPTNHCHHGPGRSSIGLSRSQPQDSCGSVSRVSPPAAESTGLQELTPAACNLLTPKVTTAWAVWDRGLAKLCLRYCSAGGRPGMATMPLSLTGLRHLEPPPRPDAVAKRLPFRRTRDDSSTRSPERGAGNGFCGLGPAALAKAAARLSLAELRELTLSPCDSLTETCVSQVSIRLMIRDTNLSIVRPLIGWYLRSDTICYRDLLHLETDTSHSTERFCFITDNLLTFIGQRCPSLRLLRLEPCTLVTDQGIRMLAPCLVETATTASERLSRDEALRAIEESPGSRNLKVLVLEGCSRIENSRKAAERLQKSLVRLDQCLLRQDSGTVAAPKFNIMVKLFVGNINDPPVGTWKTGFDRHSQAYAPVNANSHNTSLRFVGVSATAAPGGPVVLTPTTYKRQTGNFPELRSAAAAGASLPERDVRRYHPYTNLFANLSAQQTNLRQTN